MIQSIKDLLFEQKQEIEALRKQLKKERQEKVFLSTTVFDLRYKQREMQKIIDGKRYY